VTSDPYYAFIDAIEEQAGSLSGERRDKIVRLAFEMVHAAEEPELMDDDALMELFGNVKEQLELLTIKGPSSVIARAK